MQLDFKRVRLWVGENVSVMYEHMDGKVLYKNKTGFNESVIVGGINIYLKNHRSFRIIRGITFFMFFLNLVYNLKFSVEKNYVQVFFGHFYLFIFYSCTGYFIL